MLKLLKLIAPEVLGWLLKHLNAIVLFISLCFVIGLFYKIDSQSTKIHELTATAQRANEIAEKRREIIEDIRKDLAEQRRITEQQLAYEESLRKETSEQINTISKMLKDNQCAKSAMPVDVINELRKLSGN